MRDLFLAATDPKGMLHSTAVTLRQEYLMCSTERVRGGGRTQCALFTQKLRAIGLSFVTSIDNLRSLGSQPPSPLATSPPSRGALSKAAWAITPHPSPAAAPAATSVAAAAALAPLAAAAAAHPRLVRPPPPLGPQPAEVRVAGGRQRHREWGRARAREQVARKNAQAVQSFLGLA